MAGARGSRTHRTGRRAGAIGFEVPTNAGVANEKLVNSFLDDRRSRGLSASTIDFYEWNLYKFLAGVDRHVFDLAKQDISAFLDGLTCNPGGKHTYFRAIRAFYRWALDEEIIFEKSHRSYEGSKSTEAGSLQSSS